MGAHDHMLMLQRSVGNHAVTRFITTRASGPLIQRQTTWDDLWGKVKTYFGAESERWFTCAGKLGLAVPKAEEFGHRSRKRKQGSQRANSRFKQLQQDVWNAAKLGGEMPEKGALSQVERSLR
jgi:hypothetical protein